MGFKIGDRVNVIYKSKTQSGVVEEVFYDVLEVRLDGDICDIIRYVPKNIVSLLPQTDSEINNRFSIDDKVRINCPEVKKYHNKVGKVSSCAYPYRIKVSIDDEEIVCLPGTLELIPEDIPYFEGVWIGDKVYSITWGEGNVVAFTKDKDIDYPIVVKFKLKEGLENFTIGGVYNRNCPQSLFWSRPEFKIPGKPKRKVKKIIEGYVNNYPDSIDDGFYTVTRRVYSTKEEANTSRLDGRLGEAQFIRHVYEIER